MNHGNLDSKTSEEIMEIFTHIQSAGNTVVLVTHEEDIAIMRIGWYAYAMEWSRRTAGRPL